MESTSSVAVTVTLARRDRAIGVLCVTISAVAFACKAILAKLAYRYGIDALTVLAFRMLFSLPFYVAIGVASSCGAAPLARKDVLSVVGLGLVGYYLASFLDFRGLEHVSAGLERLVLFLYPTIVVLLSFVFFARPLTRRDALSLALSYGGIALVFAGDRVTLGGPRAILGASLVFGSAVTYAIYLVGSAGLLVKLGAFRFAGLAMTVSSVASLVHFFATHDAATLLRVPLPAIGLLLLMAVFATVIPTLLQAEGIRRIGSSETAMVGAIGPVVTIFLGALLLDEPITLAGLAGTVLVLAGVLLVSLPRRA